MNRKYLPSGFVIFFSVILISTSYLDAQTEKKGEFPKFLNHISAKLKKDSNEKKHPWITDIEPIKLPDAIKNSNDPSADKLKEMSKDFNQLYNALSEEDTEKSGSGSKVKTECFDEPVPQCNYTWKEGDLSFDVLDNWDNEYWTRYVYIDGQDGKHHYDDFWLESIVAKLDGTEYLFKYFQDANQNNNDDNPYPPEFGPCHDWMYEVNDSDRVYTSYNYIWDLAENDYIMNLGSKLVNHPDNSGKNEGYGWSRKHHSVYTFYRGFFTNDYKYRWFTYDEDGNIIDSGEGSW
jgi:hypothetical protein